MNLNKCLLVFLYVLSTGCTSTGVTLVPPSPTNDHLETARIQKRLDAYFDHIEKHDQGHGALVIRKAGQEIVRRSYGHADPISKTAYQENSLFLIGSISKVYNAVITLKHIEQGLLQLDDTIVTFFPDFPKGKQITIEHLLRHQSGIKNFTQGEQYENFRTIPQTDRTHLERISRIGFDFEPGSDFKYSNSGYVLLRLINQKVANASYQDLLTQFIVEPLSLKHTRIPDSFVEPDIVRGFSKVGEWKITEKPTHPTIPMGAGSIVSTPAEVALFFEALMNSRLLKPETLAQMQLKTDGFKPDMQGLTIYQIPFGERLGWAHNGGIDGFMTIVGHFDDGDVTFSHMSNAVQYMPNDIHIAMLSAVYDKPHALPDFTTVDVPTDILQSYSGDYYSSDIPLPIRIFLKDDTLFAQAQGQPNFPLTAMDQATFEFKMAGVKITFDEPGEMTLHQNGRVYKYQKTTSK